MDVILKGNILYSKTPQELSVTKSGYLVCRAGVSRGVFDHIPERYSGFDVIDYGNNLIIPGLCDLHTHAPQFALRGLGLDLELLEWLERYTFPEEIKYSDLEYATKAYGMFVSHLQNSATTRACIFATVHVHATALLMEMLEKSGIFSYVGVVGMDRNCPASLQRDNPGDTFESTKAWIQSTYERFYNTKPIITPRFIPVCSDELMYKLKKLQTMYKLPVQSHLSENTSEVELVLKLHNDVKSYAGAYDKFELFGNGGVPTVMAHCVWCSDEDKRLLKDNGVYVAHCPQSNTNLTSGIAPAREFLNKGIKIGLGSDVSGGCHTSILRTMSDAVQVSKLYTRLVDPTAGPLSVNEAFYLGTAGGGSFFGKVGSFDDGYEFDAVVLDDSAVASANQLNIEERLARAVYLSEEIKIIGKYVKGKSVQLS